MGEPLIQIEGLTKSFGPTRALRGASSQLHAGEVHALVGENGSGKSTLVKILSGVHIADAGTLTLSGVSVPFPVLPHTAHRYGIATVFQEVLVAEARSVLDNVWLGTDSLVKQHLPVREKRKRASRALEDLLGRKLDLDCVVEELPLSDRQACSIVRALLRKPRVLILDEATSALDIAVRDRLFDQIRQLSADGVGVVYISHRMDELDQIADRATVMRSGETVAMLTRGEWDANELVRLMTGSTSLTERARGTVDAVRGELGSPVLSASGMRLRRGAASFDVSLRRGELVGIAGLEGHGQAEFLDALRGVRAVEGAVISHSGDRDVAIGSTTEAAKEGIAYVPRERRQALFAWMSIRENFAMPTLRQDVRLGWWSTGSSRRRFHDHATRAKIVFGSADDRITTLSGGNQQKVVVARWLAAHPRVLVLNDPTRGIDIAAKRDLYRLLGELATEGLAVVMLSTELDEHVELMDRVLVFREHELQAEIPQDALSRQALIAAFFDRGSVLATSSAETASTAAPAAVSVPVAVLKRSTPHQSASRFALSALTMFEVLLRKYSFGVALVLALGLLAANLLTQAGGFGWEAQLANLAPLALAAMASTPSIISGGGGFDLSISPLMILTSAVFVVWLVPHGLGGAEAVPILLALGAGVGLINGLLVIVLRVQPVVVTLSMYFVLIGVILAVVSTTASISSGWVTSLAGAVGPIPGAVFTIGAPLLIWFALTHASYGRQLYAVGSNDATAFASGVNVAAVRVIAYGLGGLFAAIGGLAVVALEHSASSGLATTYTLLAIAGVALGGTSLWGGRGGLVGSFLGAATIYLLGNVLQTLQIDPQWLQVMYGLVLLFAVILGGLAARTRAGV